MMTTTIIYTIISLCAIGIASAVILYFVAQKFKVEEDPRIDTVESILPGANCGGCGKPGCRGFAEATVKATSLDGLFCPVGGAETMTKVAAALGMEVTAQTPQIAVVRCNGTCDHRQRTSQYDGYKSCAIEHSLYRGETDCTFGCLGCGDCVTACPFDAHSYGRERSPGRFRGEVRGVWSLREGLSEKHHRVTKQRSERSASFCLLREQRQGEHCSQSLYSSLHRMWKMRERMSF